MCRAEVVLPRVALLCRPRCATAIETIRLFREEGWSLALVVQERGIRRQYCAAELAFRRAHKEFAHIVSGGGEATFRRMISHCLRGTVRTLLTPWLRLVPVISRRCVGHEAARHGIRIVSVERHSSRDARRALEDHAIDYALLCSSAWLIKEPLLSMQMTKIINAHPGCLPFHRSLDSLPWSLLGGDKIGLTAHFVDAGIDTGPILFFREVPVLPGDTSLSVRHRVDRQKPAVFLDAVRGLADGTVQPEAQDPGVGTHHRPMTVGELLQAEAALQEMLKTRVEK